jgi:hypothetical protein
MKAEEEIFQLRERNAFNLRALRELARMRGELLCNTLPIPMQNREATLNLNEETMAVFRRAFEISNARLVELECQQRVVTGATTLECR